MRVSVEEALRATEEQTRYGDGEGEESRRPRGMFEFEADDVLVHQVNCATAVVGGDVVMVYLTV